MLPTFPAIRACRPSLSESQFLLLKSNYPDLSLSSLVIHILYIYRSSLSSGYYFSFRSFPFSLRFFPCGKRNKHSCRTIHVSSEGFSQIRLRFLHAVRLSQSDLSNTNLHDAGHRFLVPVHLCIQILSLCSPPFQ